mmetsp:Transcript_2186/g.3417  ORF Transcript_2186/g.3417 Transcript_2186/m.3417 type:complete len:229 (-) Transcript_2186:6-692(-)
MHYLYISIDPSLGKVDKSSLSQQTLMELLIQDIDNKSDICGLPENPKDISEWRDVSFNDSNEITQINWGCEELNGSIHLEWLPLTVAKVDIWNKFFSDAVLTGTLDLSNLPASLRYLWLRGNEYFGEIDLTRLPGGMLELDVSYNRLSGRLDLTRLPDGIEVLLLQQNCFSGETNLSELPDSLVDFNVSNNRDLAGEITLEDSDTFFSADRTKINVVRKSDMYLGYEI